MTRALPFCLRLSGFLLGAVAAACGGTSDSPRPSLGNAGDAGVPPIDTYSCEEVAERYELRVLEDFSVSNVSDDTARILGWYASDDGTHRYRRPVPSDALNAPDGAEGGVPTFSEGAPDPAAEGGEFCQPSTGSLRMTADRSPNPEDDPSESIGFTSFGYQAGANLATEEAQPGWELRDVCNRSDDGGNCVEAEWDGFAFWVRGVYLSNGAPEPYTITASVVDNYSFENAAFPLPDGGTDSYCEDGLNVNQSCDKWGRGVRVDAEWRFVALRFDELQQQGFGRPSPLDGPDLRDLVGFTFLIGQGLWDVSIDEVSYFRERP